MPPIPPKAPYWAGWPRPAVLFVQHAPKIDPKRKAKGLDFACGRGYRLGCRAKSAFPMFTRSRRMAGDTEQEALNRAIEKLEEALATGDEEIHLRLELPSYIVSSLERVLQRIQAAKTADAALTKDDLMRLFRGSAH